MERFFFTQRIWVPLFKGPLYEFVWSEHWKRENIIFQLQFLTFETSTFSLLRSLLCRKTTRTNNEPQNRIKWPGYTENETTNLSLRKWNTFLYSCLYFYVLTTIFSYKVYKSFVICKTASKHVVIYAPSLGRLWLALLKEKVSPKYRGLLLNGPLI